MTDDSAGGVADMRGKLPLGLRRRVSQKGVVRYGLHFKSKWLPARGAHSWFAVGTTREEAERLLQERRALIDRAKLGLSLATDRPQIHSFADVTEKYYRHLRKSGAVKNHMANVEKQCGEFANLYGGLPLLAVTGDMIDAFLDPMLRTADNPEGRAAATVRKYRTSLHGLFDFALKVLKIVTCNPVSSTLPPRDTNEGDNKAELFVQELPPERDRELLDSLPIMAACAASISLYHGQRREAVISLRSGGDDPDVDLIDRTIRFRGETQKRRKLGTRPRKDIVVQISNKALHYITEQAKAAATVGSVWLHPSPKNSANVCGKKHLSMLFQNAAIKAGFPHAYFHGLLHAHTSRMKSSGLADVDGAALRAAQISRGHDGSEVTKRYIHTSDRDRWAVQSRMDAWLDEQIEAAKKGKGDQGVTKKS